MTTDDGLLERYENQKLELLVFIRNSDVTNLDVFCDKHALYCTDTQTEIVTARLCLVSLDL